MNSWKRRLLGVLVTLTLLVGLTTGVASAADDRDYWFARIRSVFELVEAYHLHGADLDTFVQGAIRGGLEALGDPYTNYFTPDEFDYFLNSLEGTVTGIGVYLEQDGNYVIVAAPIKGTPAFRAGLKTGDRILEANGVPLVGATVEFAGSVIRGEPGTEVTLRIERPSENRTFEVTIVRELIQIPEVEYELLEDGIGYLALMGYSDAAVREFYAAVDDLKRQGATKLVLDLRQNPGGYVAGAIAIASAWVPQGEPVMIEVGRDGETVHTSSGRLIGLPTVVLVDGGTASASEILAGAIQDYGAGELVGTRTFGKGTVQQILFLLGGDGMKVTISEYRTAQGRKVDGVGLTPDHVVEPAEPDPALAEPLVLERVLTPGKVGLDVLDVQNRLAYLGYSVKPDGVLGPETQRVIRLFRRDHGLPMSFVVDADFVTVLNEQVAAALAREAERDVQLEKAVELLKAK